MVYLLSMTDYGETYSVQALAQLAGITVRTLHHYDHIGLLVPQRREGNGYRVYGPGEVLRLQQILFFRELDLPLATIKELLEDPGFDPVDALQQHRVLLRQQIDRLETLMDTIDSTIQYYREETMLSDEELYEGFSQETIDRYRREARERYGDMVDETENKLKKLSYAGWKQVQEEGRDVTLRIAALMDHNPEAQEVQEAIAAHHAWIEHFYEAPAELYRGLGTMYVEHPEFKAFYEQVREGLAEFMCAAMTYYANTTLSEF